MGFSKMMLACHCLRRLDGELVCWETIHDICVRDVELMCYMVDGLRFDDART